MGIAKLTHYGLLRVTGEDARAFLHAQLTNDIENLAPKTARYAGWCSAKGRLLATFLVVPEDGGFLLQLARELAPAVAKRLSMFILRSRVKLVDASEDWSQYGLWSDGSGRTLEVGERDGMLQVGIGPGRALLLVPGAREPQPLADRPADEWALAEVRAGRPLILQSTQDQFVPQMLNLELSGGIDFRKGCYPGQEVVARAQYRGAVKRRMVRLRGAVLRPGQDLYSDDAPGQASGTVVNVAGDESLAVLQTAAIEAQAAVRAAPQAPPLEVLALSYPK